MLLIYMYTVKTGSTATLRQSHQMYMRCNTSWTSIIDNKFGRVKLTYYPP